MSMKRILGMMLATKLAGRGTRGRGSLGGGLAGGLGGLAAGGLLGGRRGGGLARKAGLGALAYMAYRAYQDHQARSAGAEARSSGGSGAASTGSGAAAGGGLGGALGGIVKSVSDAFEGSQEAPTDHAPAGAPAGSGASPEAAFAQEDERAAETFSEDKAVLLIRAMVTAANADGTISADERARIMDQADEAGGNAEDRRILEQELANPRPLDELLAQVRDRETAEEFYLASSMAVDSTTDVNRLYLARLRERLGLPKQDAAEIDALAN